MDGERARIIRRNVEGMCKSICLGNYIYLFTRRISYNAIYQKQFKKTTKKKESERNGLEKIVYKSTQQESIIFDNENIKKKVGS